MASVNLKKGKHTRGAVGAQIRHCFRENKEYANKDIDPSKSHLNSYLGCSNGDEARSLFSERLAKWDKEFPPGGKMAGKRNIRSDRKVGMCFNFKSPSSELPIEKQKEFLEELYKRIEEEYGERVIFGVVHCDEIHEYIDVDTQLKRMSRAEIHIELIPFVEGKGVNMNEFYKGRGRTSLPSKLNKIADELCMEMFGYKYQTGDKKKGLDVDTLKAKSLELKCEELQTAYNSLLVKANNLTNEVVGLDKILRGCPRLSEENREKIEEKKESILRKSKSLFETKSESVDDIQLKESMVDEYILGFKVCKKAAKENLDVNEIDELYL